ncbi:MAG: hypothetical protein HS130_03020 [Deltaproteobacteria bacterium]|nr:hypothetical protein [Deltaproteobacteria bacterium]
MENCKQHGIIPAASREDALLMFFPIGSRRLREKIGEKILVIKAKMDIGRAERTEREGGLGIMVRKSRKKRQKLVETAALVLTERQYRKVLRARGSSGRDRGGAD